MKKLLLYIVLFLFTTFSACKKDCNGTFTVSGRVINGTTNEPFANKRFKAKLENKKFGGIERINVADGYTDSTGWFEFTYNCSEAKYDLIFDIESVWETTLPLNQDRINTNIYFSTEGSVELTFVRTTPVFSNDTLFLAYGISPPPNTAFFFDTIISPVNRFNKTYRIKTGGKSIIWGLGSDDFGYDKVTKTFSEDISSKYINITGDPVVDKLEIEF